MLLSRLLAAPSDAARRGTAAVAALTAKLQGADPEICGLTADSRAVEPGWLFAALPGSRVDGRDYISQAIAKGAVAVLAPTGTVLPSDVQPGSAPAVLIEDPDPRGAFARIAAAYHAVQPAIVVAVTGTNGKTSTVQFARQIWARLGHKAASLGTLGLIGPGIDRYGAMTTPDPVALHRDLALVANAGIDRLAMEASSHGLDQRRLDGVRLVAGGFTNLTRDHLDYHGSMEAYFAAKAGLFDRLLAEDAAAVLNADSPVYEAFREITIRRGLRLISYGVDGADVRLVAAEPTPHGQRLILSVWGRMATIDLPLAGRFQAMNALCALGLVLGSLGLIPGDELDGERIDAAMAALSDLQGVPGRLQHVATHPSGAPVFVDYAHTPDALDTVLTALRPHVASGGRLVCVFGCGGDRDPGKRPVMGELAGNLADRAIVTDDNPRTEEAAAIRAAVKAGHRGLEEIGDRRAAIVAAVTALGPGDVLVIAGKGHEQGQIVGTTVLPFDDADVARVAVEELRA